MSSENKDKYLDGDFFEEHKKFYLKCQVTVKLNNMSFNDITLDQLQRIEKILEEK